MFFEGTGLRRIDVLYFFYDLNGNANVVATYHRLRRVFLLLFSLRFRGDLRAYFFYFIYLARRTNALSVYLLYASSDLLRRVTWSNVTTVGNVNTSGRRFTFCRRILLLYMN